MKKLSSILICLFVLFASAALAQKRTSKQTKPKTSVSKNAKRLKSDTYVCGLGASVVALNLSQTEIVAECPAADEACTTKKIIKVEAVSVATANERYVYTVSAGRIIGEGYNVEWDLSGVAPGSYTITAGVSQYYSSSNKWAVYGTTQTRTVVIK